MKIQDKYRNFILQAVKFGLVGVLNTLITLAVIFVLMNVLSISYIISNAAGYVLGFVNSYILNKIWTFKSSGAVGGETVKFVLVTAVCYLLQLGLLILLKEWIGLNANLAQVAAMVFYTGVNFFGHKFITFRK